jgi:hypothetical protein
LQKCLAQAEEPHLPVIQVDQPVEELRPTKSLLAGCR